jgi:hypothetical protein
VVTKREWLQKQGLAGKRGRFSAAAKEALAKQINKGVKFDEPEVKETKSVTIVKKDESGKKVVVTRRVQDVPVVSEPRPDRPQGTYIFENPDGSTFKRSHTEACNRCKCSLRWCFCVEGPILFAYPYAGGACATLLEIRAVITTNDVPAKPPTQGGGTRRGGTRRAGSTPRRRRAA